MSRSSRSAVPTAAARVVSDLRGAINPSGLYVSAVTSGVMSGGAHRGVTDRRSVAIDSSARATRPSATGASIRQSVGAVVPVRRA